ncbi:MAG TPA: lipase family protein, partial [Burkholderiaceae bacterium]|nr:lipase family protein [Burkholderiaceae bacterium]
SVPCNVHSLADTPAHRPQRPASRPTALQAGLTPTSRPAIRACINPSSGARGRIIDPALVDLPGAIAQADLRTGPRQPHEDQAVLDMQRRAVLECMRISAGEAYAADLAAVPPIGKLRPVVQMSSPRLKLWEGSDGSVLAVVLGFSGTRMKAAEDLLCNAKSQVARPHVNVFGRHLPRLGDLGSGWQEWWWSEALRPRQGGVGLKDLLAHYAGAARACGKALSVSLVGHSLGAAVATLAGYDMTHFLRAEGAIGKLSIYAFNPPRLGPRDIEARYMRGLACNGPEDAPAGVQRPGQPAMPEGGLLRFSLRQFTRTLDPFQSMPLFMHHPHWPRHADRDPASAHWSGGQGCAHFATCTDHAVSNVNLPLNHELSDWGDYFASRVEEKMLASLFGAPSEHAVAFNAPLLSRRELWASIFLSRKRGKNPRRP